MVCFERIFVCLFGFILQSLSQIQKMSPSFILGGKKNLTSLCSIVSFNKLILIYWKHFKSELHNISPIYLCELFVSYFSHTENETEFSELVDDIVSIFHIFMIVYVLTNFFSYATSSILLTIVRFNSKSLCHLGNWKSKIIE